ncbi:MAG TPA: FHA domain-containing serine/threonine-protein kinase [Planctomycetota bacterium]|nr:FHA domain-containing serine/threonine-protein kinase [Planctomycetota bacterium]
MAATPRLLLVARRTWLPPFLQGKLLFGSAPSADVRLDGLAPFHAVVEARPRGVVVHDLARRGDVKDAKGRSVAAEGSLFGPDERFSVGTHELAVVVDETESVEVSRPCAICGTGSAMVSGQGRVVGDLFVCVGCLGVVDQDPFAFPGLELVARLGSGGMATVFLALVSGTEELRALKVYDRERGATRFLREARVLLGLVHPNIVRVFDAGSARGVLYLACELVTGGDALRRLAARGPFAVALAARLGADVARALAFAHGRGIVHRDVKPSNILLHADGRAMLSDFGLAKELSALVPTTHTGATLGTIAYAAPEQLRDARAAGPPADVFGLAATIFHLVTGMVPRGRGAGPGSVPKLADASPPMDKRLVAIVDAALAPRPEDRPAASELEKSLRPLAG